MVRKKLKIDKHSLIPKHMRLSEKEKEAVLKKYNITLNELPKILKNDPAIQKLGAKSGDVIKIVRKSPTAGEAVFYRGVINV
ncbi:DNA-directed RNA polymerase subunit H [Candidatus Woesearchaeota archaeon]|nr:DNA-directed RNA polymerase subunit H [Candidatus Woesearchaeota archaeon]